MDEELDLNWELLGGPPDPKPARRDAPGPDPDLRCTSCGRRTSSLAGCCWCCPNCCNCCVGDAFPKPGYK